MAPKHFVACPKHPFKQLEFFGQELKDALVGRIFSVQKVHHNHIMLLSVTMTAPDSLLDSLRIPRQVVVHDE